MIDISITLGDWHQVHRDPRIPLEPGSKIFQRDVHDGHLTCIVSQHPKDGMWHMSISHRKNIADASGYLAQGRIPTWHEIKEARYRFIPDKATMALLLPPKTDYINIMSTCMHLHELPEKVAMEFKA